MIVRVEKQVNSLKDDIQYLKFSSEFDNISSKRKQIMWRAPSITGHVNIPISVTFLFPFFYKHILYHKLELLQDGTDIIN